MKKDFFILRNTILFKSFTLFKVLKNWQKRFYVYFIYLQYINTPRKY